MLVPVSSHYCGLFHPISCDFPCSVVLAASDRCSVQGHFGGFYAVGEQVPYVGMSFDLKMLAGEFRELSTSRNAGEEELMWRGIQSKTETWGIQRGEMQ